MHDAIHLGDNNNIDQKKVIKGGFLDDLQDLDWVALLGPIRPPPEPPPSGHILPSLSSLSCIHAFIHTLRTMHEIGVEEGLPTY